MLKTQVLDILTRRPQELTGYTVIIEDQYGNPIVLVQELADGMTSVNTICDGDEFQKALEALGINKLVVHDVMKLSGPPAGARKLEPGNIKEFVDGANK